MAEIRVIEEMPNNPAIYVMYGEGTDPIYVGRSTSLKRRIKQHLVRKDSSIAIDSTPAGINPEQIKKVKWWNHEDFEDEIRLKAAELIAFEIFNPALRSRRKEREAENFLEREEDYEDEIRSLFNNPPSGIWVKRTLTEAFQRIRDLENRLE